MKKLFLLPLAGIALGLVSLSSPAAAKDAKEIGSYGAWTAYTYNEDGGKVCYMAATPTDSKGDYTKRGTVYAMITHRPGAKNVFSYLTGYEYAKGAKVTLSIDGQPTVLYGADEVAWAPNEAADAKLVAALQKGSKMKVEGASARGTATVDTFSLKGSGSAYAAISKECNVSN